MADFKEVVDELKTQTGVIKKGNAAAASARAEDRKAITDGVGRIIKDDVKSGISDLTSTITGPMTSFAKSIPGVSTLGKITKQIAGNALSGAALAEKESKQALETERQTALLESIAGGISNMAKSFLDSVKKTGGMGLGVIAGLIAAPVILLVNFFKQLSVELKFLDKLTGGRLAKLFAPIKGFFVDGLAKIKDLKITKAITGFIDGISNKIKSLFGFDDIKGFKKIAVFEDLQKTFGKFTRPVLKIVDLFKGMVATASGSFATISRFAATLGRVLGKIFLPVTVLMSIFDFVTGFMEGYDEGGIIGGIKEGIISVVDGLVGGLIRMVTGAVAWILEAIGLDKFAAALTLNVSSAIEGIYEIFRGVIDVIMFPFKLVWEMIKGIFGYETDFGGLFAGLGESVMGIFSGLIDVIYAPFNMIYGLVQDIFSFVGFELPDFDMAEFVKSAINSAIGWVTTLFTDPLLALQDLWYGLVGDGGLVDIIFSPIDKAINWVMGLFGFSEEEQESFSLAQMVKDAITGVFTWMAGLFDFDLGGAVKDLLPSWTPGWVKSALGLGEGDTPEDGQAPALSDPSQTIRQNDSRIAELEDQIARSNAGENVFWGRDSVGRDEAQAEIDRLRAESIEMERFAREQRNRMPVEGVGAEQRSQTTDRIRDMGFEGEYQPAPINVVYNNSPNNSVNTTNPTSPLPVGVTDRSTAWQAAGSF